MKYFICLLFAFLSFYSNAQECVSRLSGHVHNSFTHENLDRATITIVELNRVKITNNRGDFVFDSLCNGNYTIRVVYNQQDSIFQSISVYGNRHLDIDLPLLQNTLSGITVSAQRTHQVTGIKKELSGRELEETRGQTLGEALSRINGVSMLQTGATISKPVIHGLHGSRILTINNGVRQEGQQWGNEHAPEIDPFIANRLTVIKGVEELRYGSDAIGGVILVDPRPLRNLPGYQAELNTVYFSNNRQYVVSAQYEQQLTKRPEFTYRLQGTLKKGANTTTPHYRLNNTGNEEKNFSLSGVYRKNRFISELYYSFFDTRIGLFEGSHIGNLTDLEAAIASDKPDPVFTGENTYRIGRPYQRVQHHLVKSRSVFQTAGNHRFSFLLAAQFNDRQEFDVTRSQTTTRPQLDLGIFTVTEELTWETAGPVHFNRITGLTAMQQQNRYSGRYFIPDYNSNSWGLYHIERWNHLAWDAQAGIRIDHKNISTSRITGGGAVQEKNDFQYTTFASSLNIGNRIDEHWRVNGTLTLSNRAPHVNELLSNGIHHGTSTYEQGNRDLKPERSLNFSFNNTFTSESGNVILEGSFYNNNIKNFIYLQPKPDEPVLTIAGAFPKNVYEQADVRLRGFDLLASFRPFQNFEWNNKYSLLRAKNNNINDWLIRMPSDRFQSEFIYNLTDRKKIKNAYISTEAIYVWEQTRVPDESNGKQDYKLPPSGYFLWNADVSLSVLAGKFPLIFGIGLRNILNTTYRDYLNAMRYFTDEAGRNIQFRLRIPINQTF